jgi:hypothetical protein
MVVLLLLVHYLCSSLLTNFCAIKLHRHSTSTAVCGSSIIFQFHPHRHRALWLLVYESLSSGTCQAQCSGWMMTCCSSMGGSEGPRIDGSLCGHIYLCSCVHAYPFPSRFYKRKSQIPAYF